MSKPRTQANRSSCGHVRDRDRLAGRRDAARDALAPGQADRADLRAVEAVRGGQGQARPLVVGEVERADLDAHRRGRAVDDRAHQLVPVAGQRRELGDLVEERELAEAALVGGRLRGHGHPRDPGDGVSLEVDRPPRPTPVRRPPAPGP